MAAPAPPRPSASRPQPPEDALRALIALAALGGPERLSDRERLILGRALDTSPELRAELRTLASVAAALPPPSSAARPAPSPAPPPAAPRRRHIPEALLRPDVVGALAALVLLLGVFRIGDQSTGISGPETVATATVPSVTGTATVTGHPWGTELHIEVEGTEPGTVYAVTVFDRAGRTFDLGTFLGSTQTVRYVGTSGAPRDGLRSVRVTDERGEAVFRADLP